MCIRDRDTFVAMDDQIPGAPGFGAQARPEHEFLERLKSKLKDQDFGFYGVVFNATDIGDVIER